MFRATEGLVHKAKNFPTGVCPETIDHASDVLDNALHESKGSSHFFSHSNSAPQYSATLIETSERILRERYLNNIEC